MDDQVCQPSYDAAFGPVIASSCRSGFDFTLMFEQSILSIGPAALLLLAIPWRAYSLYHSNIKTVSAPWIWGRKAINSLILVGLQLGLLVLWCTSGDIRNSASIPASVLLVVCFGLMSQLSYLEHTRSIRPSTTIILYLLFSTLLDIPQARTLYLRHDSAPIAGVFSAVIAGKLTLLFLETRNKIHCLQEPYKGYPPEALDGVLSRTLLWWLIPLFWKGFKRILTLDDLFAIDPGLSSEALRNSMVENWAKRSKPEGRYTLPWATAKCLRWAFASIVPPRIALIGFTFAQPFLISTTISYVDQPAAQQNHNAGLGLIAAASIIYTGIAISTVLYKHRLYRSITLMRGALVGLIYDYSLVSPDGLYNDSAAVTLMSTDIDRIATSMVVVHEIWSRIIEVAIAIWLLERQLGAVCIIPILLVAIIGTVNSRLANILSQKQRLWNRAVQRRIAVTSAMFNSMKSVKMMGLSNFMFKAVQTLRIQEIEIAKGYRYMMTFTSVLSNLPQIWAPSLTFVAFGIEAYVRGSNTLSVNQAFTSLSIITLMTSPATQLLSAIPQSVSCLGCFERIQKHILGSRRIEQRILIDGLSTPGSSKTSHEAAGIELQTLPSEGKRSQSEAPTLYTSKDASTISSQENNTTAILVQGLTVRPSPISNPVIVDLNLHIKSSSITMITGPVGCGKTTLFRALLGELEYDQGSVTVSSLEMAYCSQTPWLINESIQKCICGLVEHPTHKDEFYQSVLHACCLDEDLHQFPEGDQTILGNRGITLSGGQQQRVALARAVYAGCDVVLLDDVLSALDSKTQHLIMDRLMGEEGLLRKSKSTIVLATNTIRYFHMADQIVVLDRNGKIAQQGTFDVLREEEGYLKSLILSPPEAKHTEITVTKPVPRALAKIKSAGPDQASDLTRRTGDISVYLYYYKSVTYLSLIGFLVSVAIFVFCLYFPQIWLEWWAKAMGRHIARYLIVYVMFAILGSFFRGITIWWSFIWIGPKASLDLHYSLLKAAIGAPQSYYTKTDVGTTLNRFSQDMGFIDINLPSSSTLTVYQLFSCIAQAALISTGSAYMAATLPFTICTVYFLQRFYLMTSRQLRYLDLEARSPLYTQFLESLEGLSTIRAMGWQESCLAMQARCLDAGQRPYYLLYCIQRWLNLVLDILVAILATIVVAMSVKIPSSTSGAAIGVALNNVLGFTQSLSAVVDAFTQLETSVGAVARIKNFEIEVVSEHLPKEIETPPESWPETGHIEFRGVTAAYEATASPVLRNISMTILPGQKIGICGRTGSGKSSFLLTLLRILEIQSGAIFIDGVDLSTIPRERIRTSMITIPQDPFILNDTVRVNADPTRIVSDTAIISALQKVKLWETIETRGGLDAQMKIQPLSQGQQQLFVLARAILCKEKIRILILDEATSQVDLETDQLMQDIIREEFKTHVIITVAHRLNTILDSDRVAVLNQGELTEFGDPRELMEQPSWFRDMHV